MAGFFLWGQPIQLLKFSKQKNLCQIHLNSFVYILKISFRPDCVCGCDFYI